MAKPKHPDAPEPIQHLKEKKHPDAPKLDQDAREQQHPHSSRLGEGGDVTTYAEIMADSLVGSTYTYEQLLRSPHNNVFRRAVTHMVARYMQIKQIQELARQHLALKESLLDKIGKLLRYASTAKGAAVALDEDTVKQNHVEAQVKSLLSRSDSLILEIESDIGRRDTLLRSNVATIHAYSEERQTQSEVVLERLSGEKTKAALGLENTAITPQLCDDLICIAEAPVPKPKPGIIEEAIPKEAREEVLETLVDRLRSRAHIAAMISRLAQANDMLRPSMALTPTLVKTLDPPFAAACKNKEECDAKLGENNKAIEAINQKIDHNAKEVNGIFNQVNALTANLPKPPTPEEGIKPLKPFMPETPTQRLEAAEKLSTQELTTQLFGLKR